MRRGPRELAPFHGPARGFSFQREIQPILDKHCIRCHDGSGKPPPGAKKPAPFSLKGTPRLDKRAKRFWSESYLNLTNRGKPTKLVRWISPQSGPSMLGPYHTGSARSKLLTMLAEGHNKTRLSRREMELLACWIDLLVPFCGDYREANAWSDADQRKYDHFEAKRLRMRAREERNIEGLSRRGPGGAPPAESWRRTHEQ
jgi:hypothetical protein